MTEDHGEQVRRPVRGAGPVQEGSALHQMLLQIARRVARALAEDQQRSQPRDSRGSRAQRCERQIGKPTSLYRTHKDKKEQD